MDSNEGGSLEMGYQFPASSFAMTTDPRTANQLKAVADKINTGIKAIEVTGITPEIIESIPDQHLAELNRLRKLTGVELTLHGPLVEPTGVTRQGWDEFQREQSERQILSAVQRARKLNPDGNVIVTLHSSVSLPAPETKVFDPETKKEIITEMFIVDEREGRFNQIKPKENFLLSKTADAKAELDELNRENWFKSLTTTSFHGSQGSERIARALSTKEDGDIPEDVKKRDFAQWYALSQTEEGQKHISNLTPESRRTVERRIEALNHGEIDIRDAYNDLQNLFNQAWAAVNRPASNEKEKARLEEDKRKLEAFKKEIAPKIGEFKDPARLPELADEVLHGVRVLSTLSESPQVFRPLREFAVDKAAETFSNVAFSAYKEFDGKGVPIISIENPPAGSGLARGEDLKAVVKSAHEKFIEKAVKSKDDGGLGMSKDTARKEAEKLIGVTWDVGHINMLKKYGFENKQLVEETKTIAPYLKHIHLSDNFGLEHTELPMGMGNVPIKEHLGQIQKSLGDDFKKKIKDIRQVVETGNWYQHFKTTPFPETLGAYGSPIYGMKMAPTWSQSGMGPAGYFAGYGQMLPDQHFSIYGAGFSGMPVELGGQLSGRSRLSGNAME